MRAALLALVLCLAATAYAQDCPKENPNGLPFGSIARTLSGRLVFHDDLRGWFGLQLAAPVCGSEEIQLLPADIDAQKPALYIYRGCTVTTHGSLDIPMTGYYSSDIYQNVDKITPLPGCVLKPAFPDYSKAKPDRAIRSYRVSMRIDYGIGHDHIFVTARAGSKKPLRPWQAYARYSLTGGYVFYAYCADGFDVSRFTGTPAAKPWLTDNEIAMDPESAAIKHINHLRIDYTCRRTPTDPK